jgi:hypothetical protein
MQLLELSPAEIAFLTPPAVAPDSLQPRLTRKLEATLTARLHVPVRVTAQAANAPVAAPALPDWLPDPMLATLWLTRRLGGQSVTGVAAFVPPSLIHALDAVLAECWLDARAPAAPPPAMAWDITAAHTRATLAVQLPHPITEMTRWARGVIRNG